MLILALTFLFSLGAVSLGFSWVGMRPVSYINDGPVGAVLQGNTSRTPYWTSNETITGKTQSFFETWQMAGLSVCNEAEKGYVVSNGSAVHTCDGQVWRLYGDHGKVAIWP